MKTCLCLLALVVVIVHVKGENCASGHVTDCTSTTCTGTEWVLACIDQLCSCTHTGGGSHSCQSDADCGRDHFCPFGLRWRCSSFDHSCHCRRG
ncbi:hypothetical protein ACJMK2_023645 [Sinanodonta woodiana]|uniref:Uncharacterized protein n=1 Tax=Sinanodonta woodiana TaxID=1069815 RepID=A0ABD3T519_SINWO